MQIDTSGQGKPDVIFDALTIKQANLIEKNVGLLKIVFRKNLRQLKQRSFNIR
jgi:hypothetical protein